MQIIQIVKADMKCNHKCGAEGGLTAEVGEMCRSSRDQGGRKPGTLQPLEAGRSKEQILPWSLQKEPALPVPRF